ncbi:MAG: hypothetical protein ACC645_20710 [Pirellulales bacterium]
MIPIVFSGGRSRGIGEGIMLTGPGNVICFNRVSGFRDNIILHNTAVKRGDGIYFNGGYGERPDHLLLRNNLIIGGPPGSLKLKYGYGNGWAINFSGLGPHCTFDYVEDRIKCGRFYVDTSASPKATYNYAVSVVDITGNEGPKGAGVSTRTSRQAK